MVLCILQISSSIRRVKLNSVGTYSGCKPLRLKDPAANQECCHIRPPGDTEPRDIRALSFITMELMQKYVKDDGAVRVDDLRRWPSDSKAVGFLSETTSANSVDRLLNVSGDSVPWSH